MQNHTSNVLTEELLLVTYNVRTQLNYVEMEQLMDLRLANGFQLNPPDAI